MCWLYWRSWGLKFRQIADGAKACGIIVQILAFNMPGLLAWPRDRMFGISVGLFSQFGGGYGLDCFCGIPESGFPTSCTYDECKKRAIPTLAFVDMAVDADLRFESSRSIYFNTSQTFWCVRQEHKWPFKNWVQILEYPCLGHPHMTGSTPCVVWLTAIVLACAARCWAKNLFRARSGYLQPNMTATTLDWDGVLVTHCKGEDTKTGGQKSYWKKCWICGIQWTQSHIWYCGFIPKTPKKNFRIICRK